MRGCRTDFDLSHALCLQLVRPPIPSNILTNGMPKQHSIKSPDSLRTITKTIHIPGSICARHASSEAPHNHSRTCPFKQGQLHLSATLEGHTGTVSAVTQLADGRIASGSYDRTIRLWDADSAQHLCCLEVDAPVMTLCVREGDGLAAGDDRGRLHWLEVVG